MRAPQRASAAAAASAAGAIRLLDCRTTVEAEEADDVVLLDDLLRVREHDAVVPQLLEQLEGGEPMFLRDLTYALFSH